LALARLRPGLAVAVLFADRRVAIIVAHRRLTRRQALKLGAAAAAFGALRPGAAAAATRAESFELALPGTHGATAATAGWRTTPVFTAPRRFDLIGLAWARGAQARAEVRARRHGGTWSRWTALHAAGDHGPDGGHGPSGTDPAWTGTADEFQLRLHGAPRDLRARFVRAAPAARAAQRGAAALAQAAKRQIGAPPIIPRSAWGGDGVTPRAAPAYGQVQLGFVHHTVNANDYTAAESAGIVLAIAHYHRDHNGWNDIGYNFLVDKYGQIFEGRAGGIDQAIVGAQAQGFNSVSTGVACLGTFTSVAQTEAGMEALARILGWKLSLHAVPVQGQVTVTSAGGETNRFPSGTAVTLQRISGHRDGDATSCPGDVLYGQLADLRNRAMRYAGVVARLTLHASATTLRGARPCVLSGVLHFPDAGSPAGAPVEILFGGSAAFVPIATTAAGPDGQWSATVTLPQSGTIRARFPGDTTRAPLQSSDVTVAVLPRLALGLSARRIRRHRRVAVSGVLTGTPATKLDVLLERKVGGRYWRERRKRIAVRNSRYLTRLRPRRAGLYCVTVSTPGASIRRYVRVLG
jgi:hypothetical protein